MELIETCIPGVVIVQPRIFGDERGYFFESFSQRDFERQVCKTVFVQDKEIDWLFDSKDNLYE